MHVSFPRETIRIYSDHTQPVVFAISKMVQVNHMDPHSTAMPTHLRKPVGFNCSTRADAHIPPIVTNYTNNTVPEE